MTAPVTRRVLNRTLLERQLLAERSPLSAAEALRHLVAMQAQEPNWPYLGLWTRLASFSIDDLEQLLGARTVVRSAALRSTQHLVAAEDYTWLRPALQPVLDRTARAPYFGKATAGLDPAALTSTGRELLGEQTLPRHELGRLLAERYPGRDGRVLAGAVELRLPLVHGPATGAWGGWGTRSAITVAQPETWLGRPLEAPQVERMILRYLAAFGPADIKDIQAWSGLTRLREVATTMALRRLRDEHGRELYDLPEAALADPERPAPARFLPAFDNLLLGHADRSRVIADEDRRQVMPGAALVRPTFLVDGFVRGTWRLERSVMQIRPFGALNGTDRAAVLGEAEQLLAFILPEGARAEPQLLPD